MYYISVSVREARGASALVHCMAFIPTCTQVYGISVPSITFDTFNIDRKR